MSLRRHRGQWLAILLSTGLPLAPSRAQTFTGTVVGRVFDSRQAVIVKSAVTLRSVDRGFEWHTTTNTEGEYLFQLVPPGNFTVQAQAIGFAVTIVNVEVVVATPVRADLTLRVEPLQQSFNVFGENGVAVQTENAGLGRTISPREISDLPSLTRNPYDFITLMPGVTISEGGFAVNGGRYTER